MFHSAAAALISQTDVEDNDTALRLKTSSYLIKDHIFCILLSINFMNILTFCRFNMCPITCELCETNSGSTVHMECTRLSAVHPDCANCIPVKVIAVTSHDCL